MKSLLFLGALLVFAAPAKGAELKVAAAADLRFALGEVIEEYETSHPGQKIVASYGASGKFFTQITEGAPFDLFLSADTEKAEALVRAQKAVGPSFPYAHGHLVLWVRKEPKIEPDADLNCLRGPGIKKIAIANPATAPYGVLAEAALQKAGLWPLVKEKLVRGENIAQAAQFADSGAADAGLLAKSIASSPAFLLGKSADVNPNLYEPLAQAGVVLKGPREKDAAAFRDYFLSPKAEATLRRFGLSR